MQQTFIDYKVIQINIIYLLRIVLTIQTLANSRLEMLGLDEAFFYYENISIH